MPEISVIIPAYNVEKYIGKIIGDLENQTFKDFELIIVDDGSKDSTFSVAQEILENTKVNYKMIRLERNSGVSKARNAGLSNATGNYIYFADADDRIEKELLYTLKKDIEETNSDIAICNYDFVDEDQKVIFNENRIFVFDNNFVSSSESRLVLKSKSVLERQENSHGSFLTRFAPMGHFIFRKDVMKDNKIRFTCGSIYGEDTEFFAKIIFHSKNITLDKRTLSHLVQNHSSATRKKSASFYTFNLVFHYVGSFKRLAKYLDKHDAPKNIVNYIYDVVIPDVIVSNAIRRLMIENYPKNKLKIILRNKQIKKMIRRYKFSFRTKLKIKRSIRIFFFILSPTLFYFIFARRLNEKSNKEGF